MSAINFYSEKDEFGFLSNFFLSSITFDGKVFPTVEHYFQSKKYDYVGCSEDSLKHSEVIRNSTTPFIAKLLASDPNKVTPPRSTGHNWLEKYTKILREVKEKDLKIDPEWDTINKTSGLRKKDTIMHIALYEKFKDPVLNGMLMSTGNKVLIEHTNRDSYWGDGGNGSGKNMLGKLLMSIRQEYA